ncbi:unnamed protein product [Clonostachys byssicola]|uniref:Uncharacterized protein n=1 Tax=Clonostachys byssicola TaxID=160290 RepID=A0A9N9Y514_9HYPO|nr:unnamed protein product [Clonostachys byssicola]
MFKEIREPTPAKVLRESLCALPLYFTDNLTAQRQKPFRLLLVDMFHRSVEPYQRCVNKMNILLLLVVISTMDDV